MERHLWHPEVSSQQCKDRNLRIINAPRVRRQLHEMRQALLTAMAKVDTCCQQLEDNPKADPPVVSRDRKATVKPVPPRGSKKTKAISDVYVHEGHQQSATHRRVLTDSGIQWVRIAPATHRSRGEFNTTRRGFRRGKTVTMSTTSTAGPGGGAVTQR